jgi:hypothetical protein
MLLNETDGLYKTDVMKPMLLNGITGSKQVYQIVKGGQLSTVSLQYLHPWLHPIIYL